MSITINKQGATSLTPAKTHVSIQTFDDTGKLLIAREVQAAGSLETSKTELKANVDVDTRGAASILINIQHEGFTSYSRRLAVAPNVFVAAVLDEAVVTSVMPSQASSISGAITQGFRVQAMDADGNSALTLAIPQSLLPANTTGLQASLIAYDPNNSQDAQKFPGDYADSSGNQLVSVAFNYADIKTNTGASLQTIAQQANAARQAQGPIGYSAPSDPVIINRVIPADSCTTLARLGDANAVLPGFQVPVYTYNPNSALWDLLGYGSLYRDSGVIVDGTDPAIDCANDHFILEIQVTSEIFLSQWWNLDYPLIFTEPHYLCANIRVRNEAGQALSGIYGLIASVNAGDFSSDYWFSDAQGNVNLKVATGETISSAQANLTVFGGGGYQGLVTLTSECASPSEQVITLAQPKMCQIKGKARYVDNSQASGYPVWAFPSYGLINTIYDFSVTDELGNYVLNVACQRDYAVTVFSGGENDPKPSWTVNVNSVKGADELVDDGNLVNLPIKQVEPLPTIFAGAYLDAANTSLQISALGRRDNFPIAYDLQILDANQHMLSHLQGQLTPSLTESAAANFWFYGFATASLPVQLPTDPGALTLTGTLIDKIGVVTPVYFLLNYQK